MRATSTVDSSLKSKNSYIVLHYDEESLILGLNHIPLFSNVASFACKEWGLAEECVIIETDELDICRGQYARIHDDTWDDIKDIIGNIRIRVKSLGERNANPGLSTPRVSRCVVRPESESEEEDEVECQTRSDSDSGRYVIIPERNASERPETTLMAPSRESSTAVETEESAPEIDPLHLFGDELENEPVSRIEAETTISESELNTAILTDGVEAQPYADGDLTSDQRVQQEERTLSASQVANLLRDGHQSPATTPERVLVAIEAPYLDTEPISFSVRYKHTVSAVLKGACKKHFRIDYCRASLQMVAKDNRGKTCYIPCDNHATMESLRVVDNQTFILMMKEDDEEDEDSE